MNSLSLFYYSNFDSFDLLIKIQEQFIIGIEFINKGTRLYNENINKIDSNLALITKKQLDNYRLNGKYKFDLPIKICASNYVQKVCNKIAQIVAGNVITYQMLANNINSNPRAVGLACGLNPIGLVIPCHRVVAKNGKPGGFMQSLCSDNILIKLELLKHEGVDVKHMLEKK